MVYRKAGSITAILCGRLGKGSQIVEKQIFPILEFDASRSAKIEPSYIIKPKDVPPYCVINYFGDVIEKRLTEGQLTKVAQLFSATVTLPVYITKHNDQPVGIIQGYVGSAGAAAQLEELIALGFNRFIACGAAGTLQKGISLGGLIVPNAAIRDEGTSYHYIPPSREARCDHAVLETIATCLRKRHIPYVMGKTWTTDAFYRETEEKIALRRSEGCLCVEMETATYFAVSQFRNVAFGQILYGGDDLSGIEWDSRNYNSCKDIRSKIVDLAMEICLNL